VEVIVMKHRSRYPRAAMWVGGGLFAASAAWVLVGVPTMVKYPNDLDVSPSYEGTFTLYVDPQTAAPLEEPLQAPLTIERHITADGDESGATRTVVQEHIVLRAGDLLDTTQTNVYVMDRSTVENVTDDRAFAFDPANTVDRSGAYRLNLPFDTSRDETYEVYKNEIDGTYEMASDGSVTTEEGLELSTFLADVTEAPLGEAYLAELNEVVPLPESMTLDELKPHLLAAGLDVDALLAELLPVLTPEDTTTLVGLTAEPIGLEYVLDFAGRAGVEPVTGAEVHVAVDEAVGVRPQMASLPVLQEVLGHYPDVPAAAAAIEGLDALVEGPAITLFEYSYDQTPASIADIADEVKGMRRQVLLAKVWLPLALAGAGFAALLVGVVVAYRRRPPAEPTEAVELATTPPEPPTEEAEEEKEKELVPAGGGIR
jgi:hypothetical protein